MFYHHPTLHERVTSYPNSMVGANTFASRTPSVPEMGKPKQLKANRGAVLPFQELEGAGSREILREPSLSSIPHHTETSR